MATTAQEPTKLHEALWNGQVNLSAAGAAIKCMAVTNTYVFDQDTHKYKSSVTNEVAGTGYTAGGVDVGAITQEFDTANNKFRVKCGNVTFPAATGVTNARKFVFYYQNTAQNTDATRPIIGVITFDTDRDLTTGFVLIIDPTDGIYTHTTPNTNP